jgi:hypothetical protein
MKLSSYVQAIYDAAHEADSKPSASLREAIAAALRAAANDIGYLWDAKDVTIYLNGVADELDPPQ